jgi:outer membrane immunogenic protein
MAPLYNSMPTFTWTGFYAGANAGYGWSTGASRHYDPAFGYVGSSSKGGFVGGGQVGYNYQMGMFVLGAETDLQYAAVGNKGNYFYGPSYYRGSSDGYFGTIRARAGVALDNVLLYGTGGFAYGNIGGNNSYDPVLGYRRDRNLNGGWTLGAGMEYGFSNNLTAKVEGLYVNLDTKDNYALGTVYNTSRDTEFGVLRAGLNYKFGN